LGLESPSGKCGIHGELKSLLGNCLKLFKVTKFQQLLLDSKLLVEVVEFVDKQWYLADFPSWIVCLLSNVSVRIPT